MISGHFAGKLYPFGLDVLNEKNIAFIKGALKLGLNLVDSSCQFKANEKAIGQTITEMVGTKILKRSDICLSSKVGIHFGNDSKHLTHIKQDFYYSIHPEYIESQLTECLSRFGVETIDLFSLNTPERLLQSPSCSISRLNEQISLALEHLELERTRGRIKKIGIASTTTHLKDFMHLDGFEKVKVLHFPLNIFEKEALEENLIEKWTRKGILCITQRPLMAITKSGVLKLTMAELSRTEEEINRQSTSQFEILSDLEFDLTMHLENDSLATKFVISKLVLESLPTLLENKMAAEYFLTKNVMSELKNDLHTLSKFAAKITDDEYLKEYLQNWIEDYTSETKKLIEAVLAVADYHSNRTLTEINSILNRCTKLEKTIANNSLAFARAANENGVVLADLTMVGLENLQENASAPLLSHNSLEDIICNPELQ